MARPKNTTPRWIPIDVFELGRKQAQMPNDAEFGAFCRKAVIDFITGCSSLDVDPSVRERYEYAMTRMVKRQELDSAAYRSNKENHTHTTRKGRNTATAGAESGNNSENFANNGLHDVSVSELPTPAVVMDLENEKNAYGENKKVMLTKAEGAKLREVYGENLELAIEILDGYLVNNARKAAKYKSHFSVLKKSGWVWDKVQEKLKLSAQLKKAESQPKSFAAQERERAARGAEYLLSLQEAM